MWRGQGSSSMGSDPYRNSNSRSSSNSHPLMSPATTVIRDVISLFPKGPANQLKAARTSGAEGMVRYWMREAAADQESDRTGHTIDITSSQWDGGYRAVQYGAGVCSDYAYVAVTALLSRSEVNEPILMMHDTAEDHCYLAIGDHRRNGLENSVVVDTWVMQPEAHTLDTVKWDTNNIVKIFDNSSRLPITLEQLRTIPKTTREHVDAFLKEKSEEEGEEMVIGERLFQELHENGDFFDVDTSWKDE